VIADGRGGLLYTDLTANALMELDRPGTTPRKVATVPRGGGLALLPDGKVIVGSGNGLADGLLGALVPRAKLLRVDLDSGRVDTFASGLPMANGLARGLDATIYASDDLTLASGIDRVVGSNEQPRWAHVPSANGLAVDSTGRYLLASSCRRRSRASTCSTAVWRPMPGPARRTWRRGWTGWRSMSAAACSSRPI
jgi:hypothetical protein